jgi:WD40 repeat protein
MTSIDEQGTVRRWVRSDSGWSVAASEATGRTVLAATSWHDATQVMPRIVLGCSDGDVFVVGEGRRSWSAHDARITAMTCCGDRLWTGSVAGELRCWDLRTGARLAEAPPHPSWIAALAIAPDGSWLASSCADTAVRIFDATTGSLRRRLDGHGRVPLALAVDRNGDRLLSSGAFDAELRFWQPDNDRCLLRMPCPPMAMCLAFDRDGQTLALGGRDGHVARLRTRSGGARPFDERAVPMDTITSAPGSAREHR